jgi:membrane-bound lytic murein transglycosylase C
MPLFILFIFFTSLFAAFRDELNEFKKFKKEYNKEFLNYKKKQEEEFKKYKKIVLDEFNKYKKEVSKFWSDDKITSKKVWVEYSNDFKTRKVVNFKTREVEISVIENNPKIASKKIVSSLKDLLIEDKHTAYKRDKLSRNIENRLKSSLKNVKTANVDKEKILTPIFFEKKPTPVKIHQEVRNIILNSKKEVKKNKNNQTVYTIKFKLPSNAILKKSRQYKPLIINYANKRELPPALIFAIIHTESSYNPLARSPIPAYGLMQIVPSTAGKDTTKFLYKRPILLAPSYLYNANNNVNIGSAYFYLLYYKYLKYVKNPKSRLYCAICAYNGGIGRVFRVFSGTNHIKEGSEAINSMNSDEVYKILMEKMPDESKNYLKKVLKRMKLYENVIKGGML